MLKKCLTILGLLYGCLSFTTPVNNIIVNHEDSLVWQFYSQRKEVAPAWHIDSAQSFQKLPTMVLAGDGKEIANGCFYTLQKITPLAFYNFRAHFQVKNVEDPYRCVLARVLWQNESGKQVGRAEYPSTTGEKDKNGWNLIEQLYQVPENAFKARIELVYRWDADGMVRFGGVSLEKSDEPAPRLVRMASIHHRPRKRSGTR